MKTNIYNLKNFLLTLSFVGCGFSRQAIIKYNGVEQELSKKWKWAAKTSNAEEYRIAWSFQRLMHPNSYMGCFRDGHEDESTLREIIENKSQVPKAKKRAKTNENITINHFTTDNSDNNKIKVMKEIAILFRVTRQGKRDVRILDISLNNLSLPFDLKELPLVWLGLTGTTESFEHLQNLYKTESDAAVKEDLVTAAALHPDTQKVGKFLVKILQSRDDDKIRENATFWLGQQNTPQALDILEKTVHHDRSAEVRKKAVFAITQIELEAATDVLIDLARNTEQTSLRREAIFWLSQKAGKKAIKAIENAVFNDEETSVQKQAVFALSQLPEDKGVPKLIRVAKTHPNPKIRKKAIFWLGQCDNEAALNALIEFVKK